MNYLIIKSHPYKGSFNEGVAQVISEEAKTAGHHVSEIDLVADNFNPVMTADDLYAWTKGESLDPLVKKYQKAIEKADILVFPFPTWWGSIPAILKGFCDKVFLPGWAYESGPFGTLKGHLTSKQAIVITTMETPDLIFSLYFHNPVKNAFVRDTLQACGIKVIAFRQFGRMSSGTRQHAERQMAKVKKLIK